MTAGPATCSHRVKRTGTDVKKKTTLPSRRHICNGEVKVTVYLHYLTGPRRGRFHPGGAACVYTERSVIRKTNMLLTAGDAVSSCAFQRGLI